MRLNWKQLRVANLYRHMDTFREQLFNCLLTSATLRSSLFWDVTQRRLVVSYRRFVTSSRIKQLTAWSLKMGPTGCHETSVTYYQSTLRNIPEERRSRLHRGGSLKSCISCLHSFRLIWFPTATTLPRAALIKLCARYTLMCRELFLGVSREIWPSTTRLVLLKVSADDSLKTVFRVQFRRDSPTQRTQKFHSCGHRPLDSSFFIFIFIIFISLRFWYSHERVLRLCTSLVKCVAAQKKLRAAGLENSQPLLLVPLVSTSVLRKLSIS
jgi:hypothetical protein